MPKSIDTLVEDIYALFNSGDKFDKELFEKFGDNLKDLMDYRFHTERSNYLRLSNVGKPDRQLWLDINSEGLVEEMQGPTHIKFAYGDTIEQMILLFAKMAGHTVECEQENVEVGGVQGHIDCIIDGCLVDVKSASSPSFKKFETGSLLEPGNDPFGYVGQLSAYVKAKTPGKDGYFLAIDKQLGKITLLKVPAEVLEAYKVEDRVEYAKRMVASPEMPPKCYDDKPDGKSGNRILATGCSYCKHKFNCWDLRVFYYANGPRYFTKVVKEPRVSEFPDEL